MGVSACWCRSERIDGTVLSAVLDTHAEPKAKYVIAGTEKESCAASEEHERLPESKDKEVQEINKE